MTVTHQNQDKFEHTLKNPEGIVSAAQFLATGAFILSVLSARNDIDKTAISVHVKYNDGKKQGAPSDFKDQWLSVRDAVYGVQAGNDLVQIHYDHANPSQVKLSATFGESAEYVDQSSNYADVDTVKQVLKQAHNLSSLMR